jgi:hypothetical protein
MFILVVLYKSGFVTIFNTQLQLLCTLYLKSNKLLIFYTLSIPAVLFDKHSILLGVCQNCREQQSDFSLHFLLISVIVLHLKEEKLFLLGLA